MRKSTPSQRCANKLDSGAATLETNAYTKPIDAPTPTTAVHDPGPAGARAGTAQGTRTTSTTITTITNANMVAGFQAKNMWAEMSAGLHVYGPVFICTTLPQCICLN